MNLDSEKPSFGVCSFGGTIAMSPNGDSDGVRPQFTSEDLVKAVPELEKFGEIRCAAISNLGSPSMTLTDLRAGWQWANEQVNNGAKAVIATHGTDTIEESAYFFDLFWDHPQPFVITGAMRSANELGADGPANLYAAFTVANSQQARGRGVLLVLNDQVFNAKTVTKTHSFAMNTFNSPWNAEAGRVIEDTFEPTNTTFDPRDPAFEMPDEFVEVPILYPGIGSDDTQLRALINAGFPGIVIAGMGAGHVPESYLKAVDQAIDKGVTLVMTTRTMGGRTGQKTYAYPGAEIDLQNRGVIFAGKLQPLKARLLLSTLLSLKKNSKFIKKEFLQRGI